MKRLLELRAQMNKNNKMKARSDFVDFFEATVFAFIATAVMMLGVVSVMACIASLF
ncbi:MAG: hypothetical protein IJ510_01705 [Selenomonadales bacterium]|nr:hypothetical protein [Selenomonadales bacterium]